MTVTAPFGDRGTEPGVQVASLTLPTGLAPTRRARARVVAAWDLAARRRLGRGAGQPARQSSSARKMPFAVQALQMGMAPSRSPSGIGRARSGKRQSTS